MRQQRVEQRLGLRAVVGARALDQRDRLGERAPARGASRAESAVARRRRIVERRIACDQAARTACGSARARPRARGIGVPGPKTPRRRPRAGSRSPAAGSRRRRRPGCRRRPAPCSSAMSSGTSVLWPAAWLDADDVHVVLDRLRARPPPASGTAGRCRRRSRGRRRRWRSPWRRGRGRPGPSSRPGCAAGGPLRSANAVDLARSCCQPSSPVVARPRTRRRSTGCRRGGGPNTFSSASRDLADRRARARGLDRRARAGCPSPRSAASVSASSARGDAPRRRASRLQLLEPRDLRLAHRGVVDLADVDRVARSVELVLVDADDDLLAAVDARLLRAPRPPRCAAWACRPRPPWSCRPAPRPRRSAPRPRSASCCGQRLDVVAAGPAGRRRW